MIQASKIKVLITIGYAILISLAVFGVVRIYSELRKFSEQERPLGNNQELISVNNVLAALYEAESTSRILLNSPIRSENQKQSYDSLIHKINENIGILKQGSNDTIFQLKLDSVSLLLTLKNENTYKMLQLMDSIDKIPLEKKTQNTVISKKNIQDIESITKIRNILNSDSTVVQYQKKTFLKKLSDVFKGDAADSVIMKSNQTVEVVDSVLPISLLTDTLVHYITDIFQNYDKKRSVFIYQLSKRQQQLFNTNQELLARIDAILHDIEQKELNIYEQLEEERRLALTRSSRTAYTVALLSAITALVFLILILSFITSQQNYRKKLEDAKKYSEDLLTSKERLMLTISHDIKAPLSSIIGFIELLTKSKLPTKEKYYLENMQNSSEQVLELVNKLLDYHRLDSGKQEINKINFSPYQLITDIHQSFLPLANKKSLDLILKNNINSNNIFESDPFRIRQIVNNLITNALKFTNKGEIEIWATVSAENIFSISVKDTGVGISEENIKRLFEEFERVNNPGNENIEGFGLGLAISNKLAELLNGSIDVESKPGEGSIFTLNIPITPAKINIADSQIENILSDQPEINSLRILFIDDDQVLLNVYSEMLKQVGYEPVLCESSLNGFTLLQNKTFDIVFCDIQMPDMNGFELVERIRNSSFKNARTIPIVALSARSDVSMETYKEAGFTTFLAKPFTSAQLLNVIAELFGQEKIEVDIHNTSNGFQSLISFAEDDQEAAKMILDTFVAENKEIVEKMGKALKKNDWVSIKESAHKLLPRMRMLGFTDIVSILYDLENEVTDKEKAHKVIDLISVRNTEASEYIKNHFK